MQEGSTKRRRLPWALLFGLVIGLALGSGLMLVVQWRNRPPIWAAGPWVFFQDARYKQAVTTEFFDRFSLEQAAAEALPGAPWKKVRDEQHYTWPLGSQTYMQAPGPSLRSFVAFSPPAQLTTPADLGAFGDAFFPKLRDAIAQTGADRLTLAGHAHRCRRRLFPSALEPQVRTVGSPKTLQTVECGRKPGKRYVSANRRGFRLRASSPYDAINFPYPRPTRAAG